MTFRIAGLVGSTGHPCRARELVELVARTAARRFDGYGAVYDLDDLQQGLAQARRHADLGPLTRSILGSIITADVIVIGSPVQQGSYPALFGHLVDLIGPEQLLGKPILLTAAGIGERNALVIEHRLRPLFDAKRAITLPTALYANVGELSAEAPLNAGLLARIDRAVAQIEPYARRRTSGLRIAA